MGDDWDPWKRYWREQERRMWDPWYRYQDHLDRLSWDPFYRALKQREDPLYQMKKYEEKKMGSEWLEAYYENPLDPELRQRYEMLHGGRGGVSASSPSPSTVRSASSTIDVFDSTLLNLSELSNTSSTPAQEVHTGTYVPYYHRGVKLPSPKAIVAEALAVPILSLIFTVGVAQGWASGEPWGLTLLIAFVSLFVGAINVRSMLALLATALPHLFFIHIFGPFDNPEQIRAAMLSDWQLATLISFIIAGVYIFIWWLKIKS